MTKNQRTTPDSDDAEIEEPVQSDAQSDGIVHEPDSQSLDVSAAVAEQRDKYLRLAAEFDNFRKRAARERESAEHHGQKIVMRGLLDALDDLARFAHLDPATATVAAVVDGAVMVEQKLLKSLAGHGLDVVNPVAQPFDPKFHEAVSTAPAASAADDQMVAQVYQVGYVFRGQLLRPARVVVKQWA
jgi:molecular chaperone GrpE